jgi:uncharacterized protein YndB with AHSA1/START domain
MIATISKHNATTFTTPSDREIAMTRVFDAPRRLVFEARTKPEHVPNWMLGPPGWTMPVCEAEENGKTTMTLTVLYPSNEAGDAALKTGMKDGVSESFERLAAYLRTIS